MINENLPKPNVFKSQIFIAVFLLFVFLLPIAVSASVIRRPPNTLNLVGYWPFDEGSGSVVSDYSGYRNDGTLSSSYSWTTGKRGNAVTFNGSEAHAGINSNGRYNFGTGDFTLSAWIKTSQNRSDWRDIMTKWTGDFAWQIDKGGSSCGFGSSAAGAQIINLAGTIVVCGTKVVDDGQWHNLSFVRSGNTATFYVDGVVDFTATDPSIAVNMTGSNELDIGRLTSGGQNFLGTIDEVRMYGRALSASEITDLYNAKVVAQNRSSAFITNNLIGYWTMDGRDTSWSTGITNDISGQGSNGNLVSFSTTTSPMIGKYGQALNFNGSSSYVNSGNISALNMGTSDWTVIAWVKTTVVSNNPMVVTKMGLTGGANPDAWWLELRTDGRVLAGMFKSSGSAISTIDDGTAVNDGAWHQIAATWDRDGNLVRYVDGTVTGTNANISSLNGTTISNSNNFEIGARNAAGNELYFNGGIDDVRVYNRVLSASEISQLYSKNQVKINLSAKNTLTNGLVGYWTMDGGDMNWSTGNLTGVSSSSYVLNAKSLSTTTTPTLGKVGQAFNFFGNDQRLVQASAATIVNPNTSDMSISAWVNVGSYNADLGVYNPRIIMQAIDANNGFMLALGNDSANTTTFSFNVIYGGTTLEKTTATGFLTNTWYHVVATWDRTNQAIEIYIDNVSKSLSTITTLGFGTADNKIYIGTRNDNNGDFVGKVDDVRIYNKKLSPNEINTLYLMGK